MGRAGADEGLIRENWVPIDILDVLLQMDVDVLARVTPVAGLDVVAVGGLVAASPGDAERCTTRASSSWNVPGSRSRSSRSRAVSFPRLCCCAMRAFTVCMVAPKPWQTP